MSKLSTVRKNAKSRASSAEAPKRTTGYSDELSDVILQQIIDGKSLRQICGSTGMPHRSTVMRWLADERHVSFRARYVTACELRADLLAEEILAISDDGSNDTYTDDDGITRVDHDHIARSRLRVDSRKWLAGKLAPKKYGDKLAVGGADDLQPVGVINKSITDVERALRLSRLLSDHPAVMNMLAGKLPR